VVRGHGVNDLGDVFVGHRKEHSFAYRGVAGAHGPGGGTWRGRCENLCGRFHVKSVDQCNESHLVEMMNGGKGSAQLHRVPSLRRQMQACPGHDISSCALRPCGQTQAAKHPAEPHLDTDQLEAVTGHSGQADVGDPRKPQSNHVDDLRVEDVTHQQDFMHVHSVGDGVGRRCGFVDGFIE
jgi:hypothetical protein